MLFLQQYYYSANLYLFDFYDQNLFMNKYIKLIKFFKYN
jgi:hypothetical protein